MKISFVPASLQSKAHLRLSESLGHKEAERKKETKIKATTVDPEVAKKQLEEVLCY